MFACAAGLALFHKALTIYSACFVLLALGLAISHRNSRVKFHRRLALFTTASISCVALALVAITSTEVGHSLIRPLMDRGVTDYIHAYRMQIDFLGQPRTAYGVMVDGTTLASTLLTFARLHFYYLFAPLTGSVDTLKGGYALVEALLRAVLILSSIIAWLFARTRGDRSYGILLLAYASMTFMWALGTTNFGQALRHHVLTSWIVVLTGLPAILHVWERRRELSVAHMRAADRVVSRRNG